MKKFGKFLAAIVSLAAILGGVYFAYQNFIKKKNDDFNDFDDFDNFDDFDDLGDFDDLHDSDDASKETASSKSTREYVTLDIGGTKASNEDKV